jgi:succinate-semialdehyde dehydrogenase/glutarate-semialdehyde dehydrogenase
MEIRKCPEFKTDDTLKAIDAASIALQTYRKTTGRERSHMLRRWHDLMIENLEDLAKIITWENGKPIADARTEVKYAAGFFEWFSEEAPRICGDVIQSSTASNRVITLKEPVGVCALIAPWNFPAAMITRKVGPALAAGCTVVIKAPGEAPLSALALAELAHRSGIPKGVVNVITAFSNTAEVGECLTSSPIVKKISFTGSTGVGRLLMAQSAPTIKKLSFELGGNAPFIVFDDADLDIAVQGLMASKFRISGQTCVCANRILVQKGVYDTFVQRCVEIIKTFQVGNGFEANVTHGPLIHQKAIEKVDAHVKDAVAKGAQVVLGGERLQSLGRNFFAMTVLTEVNTTMKIAHEETFGPVAAFFAFDNEEEAIKLANESEVGLAGYFFSKDVNRCWRLAEALEVGMVGVNTGKRISAHPKPRRLTIMARCT